MSECDPGYCQFDDLALHGRTQRKKIAKLERENAALRQAANAARSFIEAEYGDPSAQPEGEWLAREARAIHRKLCDAICGKDFEVS